MTHMEISTAAPAATLLKKRSGLAAVIAAAVVLASAPYASAATQQASPKPVVTHVRTLATFDFTAGDALESITVNPDNSLTVSTLGGRAVAGQRPALLRIDPSGNSTAIVVGQQGNAFTGTTRDRHGTIYYNVVSDDASRVGVWKLPPGGTPRRIAALPTDGIPNGIALDPAGRTVYVADSTKSTVWTVPASGGTATAWLTDPALAPDASFWLGANGLRFHRGAVWVSNTAQGTLLRIPVTATGAPGRIHTVTSSLAGVDDFAFLRDDSNVAFAAQNSLNQVAVVHPGGTTKTVLTVSDGLASPTSVAVRGNRLYITDAGFVEPHDSKLQRGTINPRLLNYGKAG
ncbi:SMP-30/gluconolactonase/LRE family protein [Streptomyces sp. ATCC 21386]|uniref:SMP-30/gluconolactonase/LRE family protein n=1 Tax=Streptomyces sp. ATCC 21386 TaxID=2699428 RepID=UPI002044E2E6|nr:SMP-30/gluconolactonase/LRE family protein [Streptomyces sp. ATCC 21386]